MSGHAFGEIAAARGRAAVQGLVIADIGASTGGFTDFIGLAKLLPALRSLLKPEGRLLCLVKPQFEVGPEHIGKRGVVKDEAQRKRAVDEVIEAASALGLRSLGKVECAVPGPKGNRETFLLLVC